MPKLLKTTCWKVSAAWAQQRHECNLSGIQKRCGGTCCSSPSFWPPKAFNNPNGSCGNLGPEGCMLTPEDKPVVCHLYPFMVNANDTLVVHVRATTSKGRCKGNHGNGPMMIDVLKDNLIHLFGEDQYKRVWMDVLNNKDSYFVVPPKLARQFEKEKEWAEANVPPKPRSQIK